MRLKLRFGFTIVEILVASSLFMMLMGTAAYTFQRLNDGGMYAQKVVELHQRSDAIIRALEDDMRQLQQTSAVHLDLNSSEKSFTFLRQIANYEEHGFGGNDIVSSITGLGEEEKFRSDLVWVKLKWGEGSLKRAMSMPQHKRDNNKRYTDNTEHYIKTANTGLRTGSPRGINRNGVAAKPHRRFVTYYGNGTFKTVAADGSVDAQPGDQIRIYKKVKSSDYDRNECILFDKKNSPWRVSYDYSHWYTTLIAGNDEMLSNEAFAVCNADGVTFNKDRLFVEGSSDVDGKGDHYYPDRTMILFDGLEYMTIVMTKRDGSLITDADDDDTINDGSATIDINGIASDASGKGIEKRPMVMRVSFLLHTIDTSAYDESDYDEDNDTSEFLVKAVRDLVEAEKPSGTRMEKIQAFKRHCQKLREPSVLVNYAIRLGL